MILIADDSRFMRKYLIQMLEKHGYSKFIEAENGEEAIKSFQNYKPDLVFLDITMPVVDGLTALKKIKEIDPDAKVIICSAMATEHHQERALKSGAIDFVRKPFFHTIPAILAKLQSSNGGENNEQSFF